MLKNSETQEKSFFSCYQQTEPLDVHIYTGGYPKAKALAQFVNSKAFFLFLFQKQELFKKIN